MENPTKNMMLFQNQSYQGQHIYTWRGKYSNKADRLYSVGNMYFDSLDEAKTFISKYNNSKDKDSRPYVVSKFQKDINR